MDLLSLDFWGPTLTSTGLLAVAGAIISPWYRSWIEKGIQHDYNRQIEELRSTFRRDEERLRAELTAQEAELAALRSGALQQLSARRGALDARRLHAVEKLWAAVVAMAPARAAVEFTSALNMDKLLEEGFLSPDDKRQVGEMLWNATGLEKLASGESQKGPLERPFVSPLTWALFSAYNTAVMLPVAQISVVRAGLDGKLLRESAVTQKPIREALPEWSDYINKYGLAAMKPLVDALEQKLLDQLRRDLDGEEGSAETVKQAARILEAADAASQAMKPSPNVPDNIRAEKASQ